MDFIVADNHSRLTKKPQASQEGQNSFNYVVGFILQQALKLHANIHFRMHPKYQTVVEVCSRRYLCFHGHGIMGWAGFPYYGIERKAAKEAMVRMNKPDPQKFDRIIMGHFHAPLAHPWYWIGGSLSGTDALDHKTGRFARASQVAWMIHGKHGEFDRTEFVLE